MKHIHKHEENIFDKVDPKNIFHVYNGPKIYNLRGLIDYLPGMTEDQFAHHVHGKKNDFASWIRDVFGTGTVTTILGLVKTKEELLDQLKEKCEEYDQRIMKEFEAEEKSPEEVFEEKKEEYTSKNERVADKFDEIAHSIDDALEDAMPQELLDLADDLSTEYEELRLRASELRKLGKDVMVPALHLRQFNSKLGIAKSTRERGDYERVKILLKVIKTELDEAERQEEINVKREVLKMAGLEEKDEEQLKTTT